MSIIEQKRDEIISENNTAQDDFIAILDKLNATTAIEIRFDNPVHGDVDFSLLHDRGFKAVKTIVFEHQGELTNIRNIPEGIENIDCKNQMLIELGDLPSSLLELDCTGNHLTKLDFKDSIKLRVLRADNNDITDFTHLPESLEEIYCTNNQLHILDLENLVNLRKLHCSNNPILVIEHLPSNLEELEMEHNPLTELVQGKPDILKTGKKSENRIEYLESMYEYFKLKDAYEKKRKQMRKTAIDRAPTKQAGLKKARLIKPPCIRCARLVGTEFTKKNNRYIAVCGDTDRPCGLNIQIYSGYFFDNETLMGIYKEELETTKQNIIKQKMNTLFNYVSEHDSVKTFKDELEDYKNDSKMYTDLLDRYNELFYNPEKKIQVKKRMDEMFSIKADIKKMIELYEKTGDREVLKTAMALQVSDLEPIVKNLRLLTYEIMEMDINESVNISKLVQRKIPLQKMDFTFGEKPRVIKFIREP